jgi:hypothetical protein
MRNLVNEAKGPHPNLAVIESIVFDRCHGNKISALAREIPCLRIFSASFFGSKSIFT